MTSSTEYVNQTKNIFRNSFLEQPSDEKLKESINWLYTFQKFSKPKIYIFDSPTIAQYGFSFLSNIEDSGVIDIKPNKKQFKRLNNFAEDIIESLYHEKIQKELWMPLSKKDINIQQIFYPVDDTFELNRGIANRFFDISAKNIKPNDQNNIFLQKAQESLNQQIENPIKFKITNHTPTNNGYYNKNFFHMAEINILLNEETHNKEQLEIITNMKEIYSNGLNIVYASHDAIIICKNPLKLLFDDQHRIHSTFQSAVEWAGGEEQHYVHGVYFENELFKKIFKTKNILPKEIMTLKNVEQKAVIIQEFGFEYIMSFLDDKTIIDTYKEDWNDSGKHINYELFEFELGKNDWGGPVIIKLLKVEWWENRRKRETVLGIPRDENINTCKNAVAWTFGMTPEEYKLEHQC